MPCGAIINVAFLKQTPMLALLSILDSLQGNQIMAKGMDKRRRDEKKPKKEVVKTNAAAPSLKNAVVVSATKPKSK